MTCLPFGLASAPAAFAKVTNWIAHTLRQRGLRVVVYLDDFLLIHENPVTLENQAQLVKSHLTNLGWNVNQGKSSTTAKRKIQYLGVIWDTENNQKSLPEEKIINLASDLDCLTKRKRWSWRGAKVILGKLNFASFVIPLGRLHCRSLQTESNRLPRLQPNLRRPIPPSVLEDLAWWRANLRQVSPIHLPEPSLFITTDAADKGWGAIVNGQKFWGLWSENQQKWHNNQKELHALYEALQRIDLDIKNKTLMLQTDNRTSVAYLVKQGGTRSLKLLKTARKILEFCHYHHCYLTARYIPGVYNGLADSLSRFKSLPEWHLSPTATSIIFQKFGTPEIDLFASARSAVVAKYVSEDAKDPFSQFTDAFSKTWRYRLGWIFPPPAIIPRVLRHLESSEGSYLIVAPSWNKAFWEPDLKSRASCPPLEIKNLRLVLTDLRTNLPPPNVDDLTLLVWKVQAGPSKSKIGVKLTSASWSHHGESQR
ncbi:uncharacterized protein [Choristoneura fumiferana]|uniref:uncharacterized protein n=1 Tax=Choristoneura fumiferana TaxID=7141 RepID=UPI003D155D7E